MTPINRRRFLTNTAKGVTALPLIASTGTLWAAERVAEDDPTAAALGYVHDATTAERADDSQLCSNCFHYNETEAGWGTCNILPGKLVAGPGWCKVWVAKQ